MRCTAKNSIFSHVWFLLHIIDLTLGINADPKQLLNADATNGLLTGKSLPDLQTITVSNFMCKWFTVYGLSLHFNNRTKTMNFELNYLKNELFHFSK